jgi:potassium-dependent mechanosensitive channel
VVSPSPPPAEDPFQVKRTALAQEIQSVSAALKVLSPTDSAGFFDILKKRLDLFQRIGLSYEQQIAALQTQKGLLTTKTQVEAEVTQSKYKTESGLRPNFLALEKMRDELSAEEDRERQVKGRVEARQGALDEARKAFEELERQRRQAKEASETNKDQAATPLLSEKLLTAQTESRAASETVRLRDLELANEKLDQDVFILRLTGLRERVAWWKDHVIFTLQDSIEVSNSLQKREDEATQRKQLAESERVTAEGRYERVEDRFAAASEPDQALREEMEARRRERDTRRREIALLGERLERLADIKKVWDYRYKTFNGNATPEELKTWASEANKWRAQCDLDHPPQMDLVSSYRRDLRALDDKIQGAKDAGPQVLRWLNEQKKQLETLIHLEEEHGLILEETWRNCDRFLREVAEVTASWNLKDWFSVAGGYISAAWNKELGESKDNPLTVKKIVTALILFVLGIYLSRRLTRALNQRVLRRLPLPTGTASILKSLAYYLSLVLSTVIALKVANVPLTLFTFLGGALAIGVGFGSQQIINNFISGLILLIERPMQEGDQIEHQAGVIGTVIRIGPRCTHVRTGTNVDIFIPNSTLLQSNLVNWTRTDEKVRVQVNVPVQYGCSTRDVAKLLRKAADDHGKVLRKPDPVILLREFGQNGFEFQVQFWIQMVPGTDRSVVESDIRFMIDSYFRDAGIQMPFPQRDVHFSSASPIKVSLSREEVLEET